MCKPPQSAVEQTPRTILIDQAFLISTKERLDNTDQTLQPAFIQLLNEADAALTKGPYSVTHKEQLAPSGNKHDYASYSRYWWPDEDKPDGLPYLRRDGETNPDSQSLAKSDRPRIGALGSNTETLGLAYFFTGEEKYAVKAAELLQVWFIDEATRMNPNVNHAQVRPGHNQGTKSGILDGRLLVSALEGGQLIASSSALSEKEYDQLKAWAGEYFEWLTTNPMALDEGESKNNHGSYYDAQAMYFALYSGEIDAATKIAIEFTQKRLESQIKDDGSMPEEMARTRPLFYSIYNLHAMFLVAHMAEQVNVDLWAVDNENSRLRAALDFLAPYTNADKQWPTPTLGETDRTELFPILQMADRAYENDDHLKFAEQLSKEEREIDRINLASPLMR